MFFCFGFVLISIMHDMLFFKRFFYIKAVFFQEFMKVFYFNEQNLKLLSIKKMYARSSFYFIFFL